MPFVSDAQRRKCFALQARGQAGSWDCLRYAHETPGYVAAENRVHYVGKRGGIFYIRNKRRVYVK